MEIRLKPPIYVIQIDGIGQYGVVNESGGYCLFVFTSQDLIISFFDRMELPEHKECIVFPLDSTTAIRDFIVGSRSLIEFIAIDPVSKYEFSPIPLVDFEPW